MGGDLDTKVNENIINYQKGWNKYIPPREKIKDVAKVNEFVILGC